MTTQALVACLADTHIGDLAIYADAHRFEVWVFPATALMRKLPTNSMNCVQGETVVIYMISEWSITLQESDLSDVIQSDVIFG